jgi:hypothetical protein
MAPLAPSSLLVASRRALIAFGLAAAMVNVGCTSLVRPSTVATAHTLQEKRWGVCTVASGCCETEFHAATPWRGAGSALVGHEKLMLPGADPFPCHTSFFHSYAAMIQFDIPPEPRIVRFVLRQVGANPVFRPLPKARRARRAEECTFTVTRSLEVPRSLEEMPSTAPLFSDSSAANTIRIGAMTFGKLDVTSIAQAWQNGTLPNLGFVVSQNRRFADDSSFICLHDVQFGAEIEFAE